MQVILVDTKPTSSGPSYSSRYRMGFLRSQTFQSIQSRLPTMQVLLVDTKPTSSGPSYSSRYKMGFLRSQTFQLIQNRLPTMQGLLVDTKPTSSGPSHSSHLIIKSFALTLYPASSTYLLVASGLRTIQFLFVFKDSKVSKNDINQPFPTL